MATLLTYALCSVADVKELLGISSGDSSKNNLITRKINQATEMIERYTNRHFYETTYTDEEYDATGIDEIVLKQRPIMSFSSISLRETSENENDWEAVDSEYYFRDDAAGRIKLLFTSSGRWNRAKVTYSAGYEADTWPDSLPWDLREACATLAAHMTQNPIGNQGITMKREGSREIQYAVSLTQKSLFEQLGIDDVLDSYANITLSGV